MNSQAAREPPWVGGGGGRGDVRVGRVGGVGGRGGQRAQCHCTTLHCDILANTGIITGLVEQPLQEIFIINIQRRKQEHCSATAVVPMNAAKPIFR